MNLRTFPYAHCVIGLTVDDARDLDGALAAAIQLMDDAHAQKDSAAAAQIMSDRAALYELAMVIGRVAHRSDKL